MSTILEQSRQLQEKAETTYRELVKTFATDEQSTLTPKAIATVEDSGRTLDNFNTDVENYRARQQAIADLERYRQSAVDIAKANQERGAAFALYQQRKKELEDEIEAERKKCDEIRGRCNSYLDNMERMQNVAKDTIRNTADLSFKAEIDETERLMMQNNNRISERDALIRREMQWIESENLWLQKSGGGTMSTSNKLEKYQRERDQLIDDNARAEERIKRLQALRNSADGMRWTKPRN